MMSTHPKVIFLDAVGTLFGVRDSVGTIYGDISAMYGVHAPAEALNAAFFQAFKTAPSMAFPGIEASEIPKHEFAWWRTVAAQTFQQAGVFDQFSNFDAFFANLYVHFATDIPWFIYPDVLPMLEHWRDRHIQLAVLSNFDSRLHQVLRQLGLADYFSSITISTEVGAAKPNPKIFQVALEKHGCTAAEAWHIGDSYQQDYQGARAAGIRGVWLQRPFGRLEVD